MRFGFVSCVQLGLSCLEAIYECGGEIDTIFTLQDDMSRQKAGRVYFDDFATNRGIALEKIRNINDEHAITALKAADLDWLFVIGWSQIVRDEALAIPSRGAIGMHPTLLPEGRGRAAIPWAILKGLDKTGVTMFKLDGGVDTGPIFAQQEISMHPGINATQLYDLVDRAHTSLMKQTFLKLASGDLKATHQDDSLATEWPGRKPDDGEINFHGSVHDAEKLIRATTKPYPGAFYIQGIRKRIIWSAEKVYPPFSGDDEILIFRDGALRILVSEEQILR